MSLTLQPVLRSRYRRTPWTRVLRDIVSDGCCVALIEVKVADSIKPPRNRMDLRNVSGDFIAPDSSASVLTVLQKPCCDEWRLTYGSRRCIRNPFSCTRSETLPRRFTLVFGEGGISHTADRRPKEEPPLAGPASGFAKSADKESLRATEREIDGIVHQLFHLTPAEIALIEDALP